MKKNSKVFAAIALLIVAAAGVIIFEACNKKNEVLNVEQQIVSRGDDMGIVYQVEVPDREAYIIDFKKTLKSAQNTNEYLTVSNANSFMFDLLNYDFCNINNGRSNTIETATYTLNVSDGVINIDDFAKLYSDISSDINNDNYFCIIPTIASFDVSASATTVSVKSILANGKLLRDNVAPCDYFIYDPYQWDDAADTLTKYLNMTNPSCMPSGSSKCYYTNYRDHTFTYNDPYYNTHPNAPHVYYCGTCTYNTTFYSDDMCELYWRYRDLANEYSYYSCILEYVVTAWEGSLNKPDYSMPIHHKLYVQCADVTCSGYDPR